MALFPFAHPLTEKGLLQATQKLYRESLLKVLPVNIFIALIIFFAALEYTFIPNHQNKVAMGLLFLLIPLFGLMIAILDNHAKAKPNTYKNVFMVIFNKLLNLLEGLFSILLFPMIILGLCILVYFILLYYHVNFNVLFAWKILAPILIFSIMYHWAFVPSLIIGDNVDPNNAEYLSENLTALKRQRTFIMCFFAVLLITFLVQASSLIPYYLPFLKKFGVLGQLAIALVFSFFWSWPVSLILVQQYDLQNRKKQEDLKKTKSMESKSNTKDALPKAKDDNLSF